MPCALLLGSLADMEGYVMLRKKALRRRQKRYLCLSGNVLTIHATRKAPIEQYYDMTDCLVSTSRLRGIVNVTLTSGMTLHILPLKRDSEAEWGACFEKASSRRFNDKYKLGEKIGEGGFASVFKAVCLETNEEVAVKLINKRQFDMQAARELEREMHVMRVMEHENIIKTHDVYNVPDRVLIVMDLMRGGTLKEVVQSIGGKVEEAHTVDMIRQVLSACRYLHSHGFVHRDVKLENVLCEQSGIPGHAYKLADFGYVNFLEERGTYTMTSLVGTPVYVAPEIVKRHEYGSPVDIYAIGVMLYRMLCGRYPYDSNYDDKRTMELTAKADLRFDGPEWRNVSPLCKQFIRALLNPRAECRLTAAAALHHTWFDNSPAKTLNFGSPVIDSSPVSTASEANTLPTPAFSELAAKFSSDADEDKERKKEQVICQIADTNTGKSYSLRQLSQTSAKQRLLKAFFAVLFATRLALLAGVMRARPKCAPHRFPDRMNREIAFKEDSKQSQGPAVSSRRRFSDVATGNTSDDRGRMTSLGSRVKRSFSMMTPRSSLASQGFLQIHRNRALRRSSSNEDADANSTKPLD